MKVYFAMKTPDIMYYILEDVSNHIEDLILESSDDDLDEADIEDMVEDKVEEHRDALIKLLSGGE